MLPSSVKVAANASASLACHAATTRAGTCSISLCTALSAMAETPRIGREVGGDRSGVEVPNLSPTCFPVRVRGASPAVLRAGGRSAVGHRLQLEEFGVQAALLDK